MRYVNRFYNIITISAEAVREDRAYPSFVVQCLITYIMEKGILQTRKIIKTPFFSCSEMPETQDIKEMTIFIVRGVSESIHERF
jgi:hypothetical protein